MTKKRSLNLFTLLIGIIIFSCKKEEQSIEKKLIGNWELHKITFIETNTAFPLDSFRNVFNVSLTLNNDFSFNEMEDISNVSTPLGSTIKENYTPRNTNARYLFYDYTPKTWATSRNFSIKQDSIAFNIKTQSQNSTREDKYTRKFVLKNSQELEIERLDLIVFNIKSNSALTYKLKFSYQRK